MQVTASANIINKDWRKQKAKIQVLYTDTIYPMDMRRKNVKKQPAI